MSEFNNLLNFISEQDKIHHTSSQIPPTNQEIIQEEENIKKLEIIENPSPFCLSKFASELRVISEDKNRLYHENSNTISGYNIANDCIMSIVKKLLNHPVESFASRWLPLLMRSSIGTAIHDFIQSNSTQFTELECSLKVPSIKVSGRLDALIGGGKNSNAILVEIKSCSYSDYYKIVSSKRPRKPDYIQAMFYKYLLENHLDEIKNSGAKTRTPPPQHDVYNITQIQFIYIAHDLISSDCEDFSSSLALNKKLKRNFNGKTDPFSFMTPLTIDTRTFDINPTMNFITKKLTAIHDYLNNNKVPDKTDPFVDTSKCYFCLFNKNCELI